MTNLSNDFFKIKFNSRGLTSIENPSDYHKMDYLLQDENSYFDYKKIFRELGFFKINYNINGSDHVFDTNSKPIKNKFGFKENCVYSKDENLKMEQKFSLNDKILVVKKNKDHYQPFFSIKITINKIFKVFINCRYYLY